ncbi:putative membrane protein C20F10.07 [Hypsizygus marmoreus]|uniref:Membrane protein C20F10.07 n=1 Tax=Hypsizygus marmoreus TaxID=39966 RepID=A0A369KBX7_HYPMA|nr:putative membrane protein C20F10.07 [Hypsizygus marmoreus]
MAPSFLSKFVRAASPNHVRDRSERSFDSPRSSTTTGSRSRAASSPAPPGSSTSPPQPPPPVPAPPPRAPSPKPETKPAPKQQEQARIPTFITTNPEGGHESGNESDSTFPSVTVVPPSPLLDNNRDLSPSSSTGSIGRSGETRNDGPAAGTSESSINSKNSGRTISSSVQIDEDDLPTPTATRPRTPKTPNTPRPVTPSSVATNLGDQPKSPAMASNVRKQPSNRSLNQPPPISISQPRAVTMPAPRQDSTDSQEVVAAAAAMSPIVESPTSIQPLELSSPSQQQRSPSASSTYLNSASPRDADSISLVSSNGINGKDQSKDKKRPWRRATAQRKPTGLASAIAASGLAMANHSLTPGAQQAHFTAASNAQPVPQPQRKNTALSISGSPPSASSSTRHVRNKSAELSPRSSKSARSRSAASPSRRRTSVSVNSDANSEYFVDDRPDYYSGLEEGSSEEDSGSESDDDLMDLDLREDDIPVTGFAVASNKRNADFHELFPNVPEGDYLIEDYGCALQREILIQGRLYISENHICFHANIFGWITDLSIPINEITHLEKKMTAFVIPNAIQITTRQNKYTFASFLSRDTTFDVIYNIWKLERPDDAEFEFESPKGSLEVPSGGISAAGLTVGPNGEIGTGAGMGTGPGGIGGVLPLRKATVCACGREGKHLSETALEAVFPGTPERIYNLIFASGFMKDFMAVNQKLLDIQISDWTPTSPGSKLLARNMSYIKPLNGSLGPKSTKCELRDETVYCDFDDYVVTLTTTRTPDVPSGGVFAVKTRTCIMWASAVSTRLIVTTQVEWTGRSFIKGIIERSAIDGQKVYHSDLEKAMRGYIKEHQSEFIPEGVDAAALSTITKEAPALPTVPTPTEPITEEEERKQREHERNQRGLQWAWDTFDGAYGVACRSTKGALELVQDAWEQSSSTTILWFVIVVLVFSNLWTLMRVGTREEAVRRKGMRKEAEREKWVQEVVTALWEELGAAKGYGTHLGGGAMGGGGGGVQVQVGPPAGGWREEVAQLTKTLDVVEERVGAIRQSLNKVETLEALD